MFIYFFLTNCRLGNPGCAMRRGKCSARVCTGGDGRVSSGLRINPLHSFWTFIPSPSLLKHPLLCINFKGLRLTDARAHTASHNLLPVDLCNFIQCCMPRIDSSSLSNFSEFFPSSSLLAAWCATLPPFFPPGEGRKRERGRKGGGKSLLFLHPHPRQQHW